MLKLIIIYLIFQTVYVILNTIKSILTIKSTKMVASIISAITYAIYVFVLIYTVADFPVWVKALLTAITNLVGTWVSMWLLEKMRKDKLWEIVATVDKCTASQASAIGAKLYENDIGYNISSTHRPTEYVFHIYSANKRQSEIVKTLLATCNAKYIIHEETVRL